MLVYQRVFPIYGKMTNVSHPFRYHWERRALGTCRSGANDQHRQLQRRSARRFQGLCPSSGEAPRRGSGGRGHEAGEAADTWGAGKTWSVLWDFMGNTIENMMEQVGG